MSGPVEPTEFTDDARVMSRSVVGIFDDVPAGFDGHEMDRCRQHQINLLLFGQFTVVVDAIFLLLGVPQLEQRGIETPKTAKGRMIGLDM